MTSRAWWSLEGIVPLLAAVSLAACDGSRGAAGPEGPQGPQGVQGIEGPAGPAGPQGEIGPAGPVGPQGPVGPAAVPFTWRGDWDAATGYAAQDAVFHLGSSWVARRANTNVTPVSGADWDLLAAAGQAGPIGPAGPEGVQGPVGPQGPEGPTGPAGAQGPQGEAGPVGAQGPIGSTGADGPAGPAGPVGPAGPAGPTGPTGPQGATGTTGATGAQGPVGPAGPSAILVTAVGSTFANTPVANADAVDCEDGVALQMFGATASVTVTDPNLNQRVNVAATAVFSPGGSTDQQSLFLDLCYRDGANNVFSEGLEMGALELSGTTTMPFTLGWTFGEGGDLAPGTYHFGLCGCVAGSTSTWDVEGTRVTAQLIQK